MRYVVYRLSDGAIISRIKGPASMVHLDAQEGEEFFLNCPETATHIINNEAVVIVVKPSLAQVKTDKREEIKQARNAQELAGFSYLGKTFDSDVDAVRRITIAVQAAQAYPDFSVEWTCQDNSTIVLTAAQVIAMPLTMAAYGDELHLKARWLKERVRMAANVDEVNGISWSNV